MKAAGLLLFASSGWALLWAQEPVRVNADAAAIQDFGQRISDYMKLRHTVEAGMSRLKPTASPERILHHEHELGHKIQKARSGVKQGTIFTPAITNQFRRLIALAMQGQKAADIRQSLQNAEPVRPLLSVNQPYPRKIPLQSTPPSILLNLPGLPPQLEYRIDGHNLAIRDVGANLIVDIAPSVMP